MNAQTPTRRRRPQGALAQLVGSLLLVAALAGCGGGGGTPPPAGNPVPHLTSISPTSTLLGSPEFTLTANGSNFISSSVVRWGGANRTTTFVSSTQLTATIPATDLVTAGTVQVNVFNPTPGGGTSAGRTFSIENPVPTLTSISPTKATAGGGDFTLPVNGSNFVSGCVVRWNGNDKTTTFVSSAQLTAAILASDITTMGTVEVTVFNPAPGGGLSSGQTFTIENPAPTLTSISPTSATAGGPAFTLTANGSNFLSTSVVRWNGSNRTTTFVSPAQLTCAILATDITTAGTAGVTVFNPAPGGGTSDPLTFVIVPAQPLAITTTQLPPSGSGKIYDVTLGSVGGVPPITWTRVAGSLPLNLLLDSPTGRIYGDLASVGSDSLVSFTVQAADSALPPHTVARPLSILVHAAAWGSNDTCSPGTTTGTTPISNGRIRASISPYGDIDVYSFQGTAGAQVTIETFAQRLDLDGDASTQDSYLDTVVELLDSNCNRLTYNDDINTGVIVDSLVENYTLPSDGTYFIRVRDFRGDGRPDLIYELSFSGAQ